ncbi:MAG: hypothetical protein RL069_1365, partial [Planctomycetota bacterium]
LRLLKLVTPTAARTLRTLRVTRWDDRFEPIARDPFEFIG